MYIYRVNPLLRLLVPGLCFFTLAVHASPDSLNRSHFFFLSPAYANVWKTPYKSGGSVEAGWDFSREKNSGWGFEFGFALNIQWFHAFRNYQAPGTYSRYSSGYVSIPFLLSRNFNGSSRPFFIAAGPELDLGLLSGITVVDGINHRFLFFSELVDPQKSCLGMRLACGLDRKTRKGKAERLALVFRSGLYWSPTNFERYHYPLFYTIGIQFSMPHSEPEKIRAAKHPVY